MFCPTIAYEANKTAPKISTGYRDTDELEGSRRYHCLHYDILSDNGRKVVDGAVNTFLLLAQNKSFTDRFSFISHGALSKFYTQFSSMSSLAAYISSSMSIPGRVLYTMFHT